MTLRLFLIGLVAGVGLGLPAWPTIEGWTGGVQNWMNHQLASLDSRAGREKKYVVIRDLLDEEMQRVHAARLARRSTPNARIGAPRIQLVSMPHEISQEEITRAAIARSSVAITLPRLEGAMLAAPVAAMSMPAPVPAVAAPPVAPPAVIAPARSAVRPDELATLAWNRLRPLGERLAADLAEGLRLAAEQDRNARAFIAMEASKDLYFDDAFVLDAVHDPEPPPAAVVAVVEPQPEPAASPTDREFTPLPGFEGLDPSAVVEDVALAEDDLLPAPEAVTDSTMSYAEAVAAMNDLPDNVFAPFDEVPAEPVVVETAPAAEPVAGRDVNRAVKLTREALSAWFNVLTGPALVTVSRPTPTVR
ncbi:hypothetical protein [Paludisphaera rhizosphaerae]|uniref:hypothetical protein n=1 Tax=Paludisphaera rhizosphaerae TaxID=2711216 RepID=UPI0013ECAF6A|nr:hypothetical protein [Paludisphaera rhizosphaerae]